MDVRINWLVWVAITRKKNKTETEHSPLWKSVFGFLVSLVFSSVYLVFSNVKSGATQYMDFLKMFPLCKSQQKYIPYGKDIEKTYKRLA